MGPVVELVVIVVKRVRGDVHGQDYVGYGSGHVGSFRREKLDGYRQLELAVDLEADTIIGAAAARARLCLHFDDAVAARQGDVLIGRGAVDGHGNHADTIAGVGEFSRTADEAGAVLVEEPEDLAIGSVRHQDRVRLRTDRAGNPFSIDSARSVATHIERAASQRDASRRGKGNRAGEQAAGRGSADEQAVSGRGCGVVAARTAHQARRPEVVSLAGYQPGDNPGAVSALRREVLVGESRVEGRIGAVFEVIGCRHLDAAVVASTAVANRVEGDNRAAAEYARSIAGIPGGSRRAESDCSWIGQRKVLVAQTGAGYVEVGEASRGVGGVLEAIAYAVHIGLQRVRASRYAVDGVGFRRCKRSPRCAVDGRA